MDVYLKGLPIEQAAVISCAGVTVYKGLKVSEVRPGQWVVIVGGSGNLGHAAIQYAKAMGMRVIGAGKPITQLNQKSINISNKIKRIVLDCGDSKCQFMKDLGCDGVVDVKKEDIVSKVILLLQKFLFIQIVYGFLLCVAGKVDNWRPWCTRLFDNCSSGKSYW